MDIHDLVEAQRAYFNSGATLPLSARKTALKRLREAVTARENDICDALKAS